LEAALIAGIGWERETDTFVFNKKIYSKSNNQWLRTASSDRGVVPSDEELVEEFKKRLAVNKDKSTDFIRLSLETYIPMTSQQWLQQLIVEINNVMRDQSVAENEATLREIETTLKSENLAEVKSTLFQIAEEKRKEIIIAKISPNYALMTIDAPTLPEKKSGPLRALLVLLSMVLAILFYSVICVLIVVKQNYLNSK
jgi:capsule polysaccharide export protein KpsE/RkpR